MAPNEKHHRTDLTKDAQTGAPPKIDPELLDAVAQGRHYNPHGLLGAHLALDDNGQNIVVFRTLRPGAESVKVKTEDGVKISLTHEHHGVWAGSVPREQIPDYRLKVTYPDAVLKNVDEPYRFLPTVKELDLHLIREGQHNQLWKVLGANIHYFDGPLGTTVGVAFAIWAPGAQAVRVAGDFNNWDGTLHAARSLGDSGVWEIFIPGAHEGQRYKFEILGKDGIWRLKADPLARQAEVPPATASIVTSAPYDWDDSAWLTERNSTEPHLAPMSVYEIHLGSWKQGLSYRELAEELPGYLRSQGFTHVEFMPVMEHPFAGSWGYQVTSYYAPTSRFGPAEDLKFLIDALHNAGIGVILDWVPAHFPKDEWALARLTGEAVYEYADPRIGEHPDWGTLVFDFGRPEVRNFLIANALYWFEEFHVDGLRVDAVASMLYRDYSRESGAWVPNQQGGRENLEAVSLLQELNAKAYAAFPGISMIAEESTSWTGVTAPTSAEGLGFGFKWNLGWMHDTLDYFHTDPIGRSGQHHELTFSMLYAFSENFVLPLSHDEVVHGKGSLIAKMPGYHESKIANLRALYAYQWTHPGKKLLFMGQEFGQEAEWSPDHSLAWDTLQSEAHRGLQSLVRDLNHRYVTEEALHGRDKDPAGFQWLEADDAPANVFAYIRWDEYGNPIVVVLNLSGTAHHDYRLGLPWVGKWHETLNTNSEYYGGTGTGNLGLIQAENVRWHGQEASAKVFLPALTAILFQPVESIVT